QQIGIVVGHSGFEDFLALRRRKSGGLAANDLRNIISAVLDESISLYEALVFIQQRREANDVIVLAQPLAVFVHQRGPGPGNVTRHYLRRLSLQLRLVHPASCYRDNVVPGARERNHQVEAYHSIFEVGNTSARALAAHQFHPGNRLYHGRPRELDILGSWLTERRLAARRRSFHDLPHFIQADLVAYVVQEENR